MSRQRSIITRARAGRAAPHRSAGAPRPVSCAVITVSDTRRGREDTAGARIERLILRAGHRVATRAWVKDEPAALRRAARAALARPDVDALVVTGGTGLGPRDRTPEALAPLVERAVPGFGELFRVVSVHQVGPAAWLSRAEAFVARGRLVVLLPGSLAAVDLALRELLLPELVHAVRMLGRFRTSEA
ncbi:MAG TPA: molybdenum cofactor biosynthesis protein B [Terriglobales bacterium]|nr:molybdenum cofactor biosynthesis protein B [Terriglobales bacterium]